MVNINVTFANEIISFQTVINKSLEELQDKIVKILGNEEKVSKYYKMSLKSPVVLLLQLLESIVSSINNIQQTFMTSQIEYDPYYLLKKYVPQQDWDEFQRAAEEYKTKKQALAGDAGAGGPGGSF